MSRGVGSGLRSSHHSRRGQRRSLLRAGAAGLGGAALAACTGLTTEPPDPLSRPRGKVVFASPATTGNVAVRQPQIAAFNRRFPELTVEMVAPAGQGSFDSLVQVMLASDTPPDVFESGNNFVPALAARGLGRDLGPWIKRDRLDLNDFYRGVLSAMTYDGKLVALTDSVDTEVMYYNRDLFRRAGIREPDFSWTYDQWLDAARRMTRATDDPPVWGGHHGTTFGAIFDTVWGWGGDVFSEDGKSCLLGQPAAVAALQWVADLWNRHQAAPPPSYTSVSGQGWTALFPAGRIGLAIDSGGWVGGTFAQSAALDWRTTLRPKGPNGRFTYLFMAIFAVAGTAKNPEGGWQWLKYMTSAEGHETKGGGAIGMPSRKSLANHPSLKREPWLADRGMLAAWHEAGTNLRAPRPVLAWSEVTPLLRQAWAPLWAGEKTAKQAMDEAIPGINALLARA